MENEEQTEQTKQQLIDLHRKAILLKEKTRCTNERLNELKEQADQFKKDQLPKKSIPIAKA